MEIAFSVGAQIFLSRHSNLRRVGCNRLFGGHSLLIESLNRLSVCELHQMTIRVAQHREIPDAAARVPGRLDKYPQFSPSFGNLINLLSQLTLEAEVIHA